MKKSLKIIIFSTFILVFIHCDSVFQKKEANCVLVGDLKVQEDSGGDIKFLGEIKNEGDAKDLFCENYFHIERCQRTCDGIGFYFCELNRS